MDKSAAVSVAITGRHMIDLMAVADINEIDDAMKLMSRIGFDMMSEGTTTTFVDDGVKLQVHTDSTVLVAVLGTVTNLLIHRLELATGIHRRDLIVQWRADFDRVSA